MIPVRIGRIDLNDETMRGAVSYLIPEELLSDEEATILFAQTAEGLMAGALAVKDVSSEEDAEKALLRLTWLYVLPELRRNGIATVLTDMYLSALASQDRVPSFTVWYGEEEDEEGLGDFLENTHLFDISEEEAGKKTIRIALWNGETFNSLEAKAEIENGAPGDMESKMQKHHE